MKRLFLLLLILFALKVSSYAQPSKATVDLGLWGGVTSYQGDMTELDRMGSMGNSAGVFFRYNFNPRYAVRITGLFSTIVGKGYFDALPWEFSKPVSEASAIYEFNFWPYEIGNPEHNITTFLTLGVGISSYPDATASSGSIVEGIYIPPVSGNSNLQVKTLVTAFNIPLGFGFKFNVTKRVGMGAEFVMRKYFDDRLDNMDDPRAFGKEDIEGYTTTLHNNDWTYHLGVFVCYQMFRADKECALYD